MSYCLNPVCNQPQNLDVNFCQSCGKKLLLRERYRAVRQIGQGGFGKTFLAVDQDLPNKPACVIKLFSPSPEIQGVSALQKATELFEQEAVQLNILGKHPQIPELLAHFEQDGRLYLVQEYVKGRNLAEELAQDGAFSEAKIRELLVGLLPVLQYIHDNQVIHRDIKPENIIRRNDGKLFLVDFGAVRLVTGSALLRTGTVIGDPRYMPSEQVRGKADFTSDLYALGVSCLHLLSNVEPVDLFDDSEDEWIWRDYLSSPVSQPLGILLDKMVEKAIKRRHQSASAILRSLGVDFPNQATNSSNVKPMIVLQSNAQVSLVPIKMGNKWGYQNESGQVITTLLFDEADRFLEGLAAVKFNGKWGFIDSSGQFLIEPKFDEAYRFDSGLARVKANGKWSFINPTGQIVFTPKFDAVGDFQEGLARVGIGQYKEPVHSSDHKKDEVLVDNTKILVGKYGFVGTTGEVVIEPQFDRVGDFLEGLVKIAIGNYIYVDRELSKILKQCGTKHDKGQLYSFSGKYGYADKTGKIVIRPEFQKLSDFENGLAIFRKNNIDGFIDKTGREVFVCECLGGFSEGIAAFNLNDKWGYIDRSAKIVIRAELDDAGFFSEGLAPFKLNGKWGYIDSLGRVAIEAKFKSVMPFDKKDGKCTALVAVPMLWGLSDVDRRIDQSGNFVDT